MVSTRNSARKQPKPKEEDDNAEPETVVDSPKKTPKSNRKKQRKEALKSKNTGVGLSISINEPEAAGANKKIVFDEDNLPEMEVDADDVEGVKTSGESMEADTDGRKEAMDVEDDDDEDAVEEVKGSAAREEILEQIKTEEIQSLKTKKKKKRKERETKDDEDDDDEFDEAFFAELEAARAQEAAEKAAQEAKNRKGRHTTFVFNENEGRADASAPKKVAHNIQVVVLPDEGTVADNAITAIPDERLSQDAIVFSRGNLLSGADKGSGKKKKSKTTPKRVDTSWKRSRKMGLLVGSQVHFHRRGGRGRPAANFVTSKR